MDDFYYEKLNIEKDFGKVPHIYFDKKAETKLKPVESALLTVIEKETFGYQKDRYPISMSIFEKLTKQNKTNVYRGLKSLEQRKIIICYGTFKRVKVWGINLDFEMWQEKVYKIVDYKIVDNEVYKIVDHKSTKLNTIKSTKLYTIKDSKDIKDIIKDKNHKKSHYDFEELEREIKEPKTKQPKPIERTGGTWVFHKSRASIE